jgi:hypothetical protein
MGIWKKKTMSITWLSKDELINTISAKILNVNSVLDVGPGIQPQSFIHPIIHILVEPYLPYIKNVQSEHSRYPQFVYLNATWDKMLPCFPDKSIDTIFAIDVIEHFTKEDGLKFIAEVERVALKQVVIFTPLGWYPQTYKKDTADRWGMEGGRWQTHHSGWEPSDFPDGWDHYCSKEFHLTDQNDLPLEQPFGAFWAIRTFNDPVVEVDPFSLLNTYSSARILRYLSKRVLRKIQKNLAK